MRFTNSSFNDWSRRQSTDVSANGKRNTTTVTPEMPCVPRSPLRQHLTCPNSANRCAALERRKARDEEKQEKAPALLLRRCGHNRPQCGRFRGRGADAFLKAGIFD